MAAHRVPTRPGHASPTWTRTPRAILSIARKDARIYFLKGPNLTFGLLLPGVLFWAFAMDRAVDLPVAIPGLIAVGILFGAGAIQGVALPLERATGTLHMVLTAPVTPWATMLGKALAGTFFGVVLAIAYAVVAALLAELRFDPLPFLLTTAIVSLCFSAFGLLLATPFRDIPQAMPPATVVRIAMVFLSGTFVPLDRLSPVSQGIARVSPLTYGVEALRQTLPGVGQTGVWLADLAILMSFSAAFLVLATWVFRRTTS